LKSKLIAHLIPLQRVRFVICLTAAPISALKTAVRQNPLSLSCSGFRFGSGAASVHAAESFAEPSAICTHPGIPCKMRSAFLAGVMRP
jgi:hypothetical protein